MKLEIWKDIRGYEGSYQVSDEGRVRSLPRQAFNGHTWHLLKGRMLRQGSERSGQSYRKFVILCKNSVKDNRKVHHLVLETFVGSCPTNMEACHYDGDAANNNLTNLRWDTKANNSKDSIRHGTALFMPGHLYYPPRESNAP